MKDDKDLITPVIEEIKTSLISHISYSVEEYKEKLGIKRMAYKSGKEIKEQDITYNNSHRPERAVHSRKYYQKNKDKKLAQKQKYRETHSKEIKEARQRYNNANRDEINKKSRISRQKRKEEIATLRAEALKAQEVNTHE